MSKLRTAQSIFARNIATLILWCFQNGYEVTLGEAWRPVWVAEEYAKQGIGIANSLHTERLAVDLNLFKDGKFITTQGDYRRLGEAWKQIHPDNRAGVDFGDGPHFSMSIGDGRS